MFGFLLKKKFLIIIAVIALVLIPLIIYWQQSRYQAPNKGIVPKTAQDAEKADFENSLKELEASPLPATATPKEKYTYHFTKANDYSALGKQDQAIAEFKKAEASGHPLTYEFYSTLGLAYELSGDKGNAIKAYQEAINKVNSDTTMPADTKEARINGINYNLQRVQ